MIGLAFSLMLGGVSAKAGQKSVAIPKMMTWSTYEVGTGLYMAVGYVSTTLFEKYGIKIRVIPAASEIARYYPARLKDAEFVFTGLGGYFVQEGLEDLSAMEWGPQPIRAIYYGQHPGLSVAILGDSDIHTAADLKGKRIAAYPSKPLTLVCEVHLAFAGLTWDDVVKVMCPSVSGSWRMQMDGHVDGTMMNPTASKAYEMASMPHGLRYVPLPVADKEGWARVKKQYPAYSPFTATIGAGLSPEKPVETCSYPYPVAFAYDFVPEEKAYIMTKLLVEAYPDYAKKHKSLKAYWTPDICLKNFDNYPLPMHRGSIRYFKEIGKWTPEREAKNRERLQYQAKLRKLWDDTVNEALQKKMKSKKFPEFWLKKRAGAGF